MNTNPTTGSERGTPTPPTAQALAEELAKQLLMDQTGGVHEPDKIAFAAILTPTLAKLVAERDEANSSRDAIRNEFDRREAVVNKLRAQLSEANRKLGEARTAVTGINPEHDKLCAVLAEVVVIDDNHKLDLLVGGYERVQELFSRPTAEQIEACASELGELAEQIFLKQRPLSDTAHVNLVAILRKHFNPPTT